MANLFRSRRAVRDAQDVWYYIATRNLAAADGLADRLERASLAASPGIGRQRPELGSGIRSFPVGSYLILYRETRGGILVLRYIHGARDLSSLPLEP
jgi:toxin ParE1/3/4